MKSMTKLMVVAMVLVAALVVAPAAARDTAISTNGANVFIGEEDLNFTYSVPAGETVAKWVHYSDPSAGTVDKTLSATNGNITRLDKGIPTGSYYVFTNAATADTANRSTSIGYVNVQEPSVTLDVVLNSSGQVTKDSLNGKTVTRDTLVAFKLVNNLYNLPGAAMNIEVTLPGGGVTTEFGGQPLKNIPANGVDQFVNPVNLSAVSAGTYTAQAKWPSTADFYGKGYDSNTVTFEVATKALAITSNKDAVIRGNSFTVTITGESKQNYHLFVKNVSNTIADHPVVAPGQNGIITTYYDTNVTVDTNAAGTRSVQFNTSQSTDDRTFTIRVQKDGTTTYDEVKVRVETGAVTATASGTGVYYVGEEITLSGTNTDSDYVYLFLTGPNLGTNGVKLSDTTVKTQTGGGENNFTRVVVDADDTWSYKWDTSSLGQVVDAGGYTVYAVADDVTKDDLGDNKYATVGVNLRSAFITATSSGATVAKGDKLTISGTAQGNPTSVNVWIFGKNYRDQTTASVESDSSFEYTFESGVTRDLTAGQYFVVVQHPMYGGFGVDLVSRSPFTIGGSSMNNVVLGNLQAAEAANALVNALDSPNVDDTYTKLTFVVEEANIFIDPIGDKAAGSTFTISGTTNLAVGDQLILDVTSAAFQPGSKTEASGFSSASGTAIVQKGDGVNTWSMDVDATGFKPDQYIVKVESIETGTTQTATFNVVAGDVTTQPTGNVTTQPTETATTTATTTTEPTPTTTPGFGALLALAGLGAVAFLVLRRD